MVMAITAQARTICTRSGMEANRQPWHMSHASGGGMLMTAGIHALDRLLWLVDSPVQSVTAVVQAAGGKVLACGNGGSAADAQHMATEYVVRYMRNRRAYPAIALTTDTSVLTAHSNDYGYETVFARLAKPALAAQGKF